MQRKHTLLCFLPGAFLPSIRTHNQGQSTQNTTLFEMRMYLAESPSLYKQTIHTQMRLLSPLLPPS